jgi:DNA-binding NtrC family response regulator
VSLLGTILVVDDHIHLAENLAEILEELGYEVAVAASAEAALERIGQGGVAALVTDYRLPGLSGAALIAELRRRKQDIPAIVISAFTDDETIATSRSAGAFEVLAKPVEIDRLLSLVEDMGRHDQLILLAEDNHELAENLVEILGSRGYSVQVKTTVADAMASGPAPLAAILDYRFPDGTGIEIAERLSQKHPKLRVLFISGYSDELGQQLQGPLAEATRLEKPLDIARLLAWVRVAVGNGKTERTRS